MSWHTVHFGSEVCRETEQWDRYSELSLEAAINRAKKLSKAGYVVHAISTVAGVVLTEEEIRQRLRSR